jgi:hypothetical protein
LIIGLAPGSSLTNDLTPPGISHSPSDVGKPRSGREFGSRPPRKRKRNVSRPGPKVPGIGVAPTIGIGRDAKGNYHFLIGGGDFVYPPSQLPGELRRLLGGGTGTPKGPPTPVKMPSKNQLQKADGSFRTYEEYERDRKLWHSAGSNFGTIWPPLPPVLYEILIDYYSGSIEDVLMRPLIRTPDRSSDYGDFPLPSGDTGTV